jgi:ComF family protein
MIQTLIKNILVPFQDFIYPPVCLTCNNLRTNRSSKVCANCWSALTPITDAHPTWQEIKGKFRQEGVVEDVMSYYLFEKEGKLQEIVHLLKYRGIRSVGIELGRIVGGCVKRDLRLVSADYLLPVPLHRIKRRERGYNQSEYICEGISEVTNIPVNSSLLVRRKYTHSQTQLNIDERRQNVGDAFMIEEKYLPVVKDKTFILVDDVITTGSTINACARELQTCGAMVVYAVSAALAQ